MIDIHNHIIPGVDDGATSLEMAMDMGRMAEKEGITKMIATPHHHPEDPDFSRKIRGAVKALNLNFRKEGLSLRLYPGAEAMLSPVLLKEVKEKRVLTLNDSDYLLVEFPFFEEPLHMDEVLYQLRSEGLKPVIAHPERYRSVRENPDQVRQWILKGSYMQVNHTSILGVMGKSVQKTARHLLTHHMVHFLGSDSHSNGRRRPYGKTVIKQLEQWISKEEIQRLMMNGEALLEKKSIEEKDPVQFPKAYPFLEKVKQGLFL